MLKAFKMPFRERTLKGLLKALKADLRKTLKRSLKGLLKAL
jgi:hypothetical protein